MKKLVSTLVFSAVAVGALGSLSAEPVYYNAAKEIPEAQYQSWERIPDVAEYGRADWSNAHTIGHGFTVGMAMEYADMYPEITYFFFVKGGQMVLVNSDVEPQIHRAFQHGDVVFFTGTPWWGTAPGLADGYIRKGIE